MTAGIGGTKAHVLHALSEGIPGEQFGRASHLPQAQLAPVVDGLRARGLVGADGWLNAAGRPTTERVETLTDELAAAVRSSRRQPDRGRDPCDSVPAVGGAVHVTGALLSEY